MIIVDYDFYKHLRARMLIQTCEEYDFDLVKQMLILEETGHTVGAQIIRNILEDAGYTLV